jgi:hypothetical protein
MAKTEDIPGLVAVQIEPRKNDVSIDVEDSGRRGMDITINDLHYVGAHNCVFFFHPETRCVCCSQRSALSKFKVCFAVFIVHRFQSLRFVK